jgi:hypothetical protein
MQQIAEWLQKVGLGQYAQRFAEMLDERGISARLEEISRHAFMASATVVQGIRMTK